MIKRLFDIIFSALALLMLSPVILVVAALVKSKLGSPVIFRQTRPGLGGKPFQILKFRTMLEAFDKDGKELDDRARLAPFGRFLRSTSLDELPALYNVLKGDMSIVGPRPLLMRYMPYYSVEEMQRHDMRPGLTGLAQVRGRNNITWEEKLSLDVIYVKNASFLLDMKIIAETIIKVLLRSDVLERAPQGALDEYRSKREDA